MANTITLSAEEIQSGLDRVRFAEMLIEQLPENHDGRNTWLMNYGIRDTTKHIRAIDNVKRENDGLSPRELIWCDKTKCLESVI
ncbi:MAG: hypothetical protein KJ556_20810 [Gammaproteobacteria bacterium]|nr:hypothetical protein [Gammaproteobacteria bacterium]